jgi:hypothetical protein
MERIHMNIYKEIIYWLRAGESERSISRDMEISRPTVHKYKIRAGLEGYLDQKRDLPGNEELAESLGPAPEPHKTIMICVFLSFSSHTFCRMDGMDLFPLIK